MKTGIMLITYSALIVGCVSFFKAALSELPKISGELSFFLLAVKSIGELFQYLAPFVFAAIGVNMISHALTQKAKE